MRLYPALLLLAATSFGSHAQNPEGWLRDALPSQWEVSSEMPQTLPDDDAWWHTFYDPMLDRIIEKAVANNYNVAVAIKRIEMAKASVKQARAGYLPTINLGAGWSREQDAGASNSPRTPDDVSSSFMLSADMNWEIDIFGKVREGVKAEKAAYRASRAQFNGVMVSLCAQVAKAYMQLRCVQRRLQVANAHIKSQEQVVKTTQARFEANLEEKIDVKQAEIVLLNTQQTIPGLESQVRTLINTISVLVGEYPGQLASELRENAPLPAYRMSIDTGIPSDLLRRRPDIQEAEATVGQYAAQLGVARKDWLPSLSLTGSIGTEAHNANDLFGTHSLSYNVAPQLTWTLFDGLARNYKNAEAKYGLESAIDSYNLTVMNAVQEVDNALINYESTLKSIELQKKVATESEKALSLAMTLYKAGLTPFYNVLDGQMNWLNAQNNLVELEGQALTSLITIYQALGGGWESQSFRAEENLK